ncbi:MAG TPA: nucleotide exchange factor GrpE [Candidatus Limnocylindria bacterium]|jgi:molecular chaperone GrpE
MDDQTKRAEELLAERLRMNKDRKPNGAAALDEPVTESGTPAEPDNYKADLQRMAADFANYRKRNDAERAEFAKFAKADLIVKLLDVLDGYDRALTTVPEELRSQPWIEGMWLVERKLRQVLEAEGLVAVESLGQPFDPRLHEAAAHTESAEPEGTVIEEFQKAYRLHDRVIRPALVAVAKATTKES